MIKNIPILPGDVVRDSTVIYLVVYNWKTNDDFYLCALFYYKTSTFYGHRYNASIMYPLDEVYR